jgi:hypothetical protein
VTKNLWNYKVTQSLANGTHYWRVAGINDIGQGSFSSSFSFTISGLPGITLSKPSLSESSAPENSVAGSFDITNTGEGNLNYTSMTMAYDGFFLPEQTWHLNNFSSFPGTGYTNSGWSSSNGGATVVSGGGQGTTATLTSPSFSTIDAPADVFLLFDELATMRSTSYCMVEYSTNGGTDWQQIYYNTTSVTTETTRKVSLPVKSANTRLRFTGFVRSDQGLSSSWWIDDITVKNDNVPYAWYIFNSSTSGTVAASSSNTINYTCSATGLAEGTYTGTITIESNAGAKTLPTTFTVATGGPVTPATPANLTTSIVSGNVYINWDNSADATSYDVYSSANPYGTFSLLTNVTNSEYTYTPGTNAKMFFYIVAKNSTKQSPPSIIVK